MEVDGRIVVKASLIINLPFEKALSFFSDPAYIKNVSDNVDNFEILYDNKTIRVVHVIMKLPGPISNREVVAVNTTRVEGNKAYCGNRSCIYPCKNDSSAVRAQLYIGGNIIESAEGGKTKVTSISDIDIKGSIPDFVKKAMSGKRVENLLAIEKKISNSQK